MNKRGEWSALQFFSSVGGVLLAVALVTLVITSSSQEGSENHFFAKDSALLTDAIMSAPGDVQVIYPRPLPGRYARLNSTLLSIFSSEPEPNETSVYRYPFIPREDITIVETEMELASVYFIKEGDRFMISTLPIIKGVK